VDADRTGIRSWNTAAELEQRLKIGLWPLDSYGFDLDQVLVVTTRTKALPAGDSLWSLQQALKSGHVGAVVAWLPPRLRAERVRRLQLAAHNHDGAAFVFRESAVADRPSASPLRRALRAGGAKRRSAASATKSVVRMATA
jgi:protein ImuA